MDRTGMCQLKLDYILQFAAQINKIRFMIYDATAIKTLFSSSIVLKLSVRTVVGPLIPVVYERNLKSSNALNAADPLKRRCNTV